MKPPATYDSDFAETTAGVWLRESVWSRLGPFVKPGMHALDLGCGTGEDALWLARNACRVTAADGSPAMLEKVAVKAARLKLEHRVRTMSVWISTRRSDASRRSVIPSIW